MEPKTFGIGLPKTGLTSMLIFARNLGFEARGRDRRGYGLLRQGRYGEILDLYTEAEFWCDVPTPLMYKLAFERFPGARFVLTVRRDARTWYESLCRHNRFAHPLKNKHRWIFGRYYPHGFAEEHMAYYERHNREAEAWLRARGAADRLLILQVDTPGAAQAFARFLGRETDATEFPRENVSAKRRLKDGSDWLKTRYNDLVQPVYARWAPRLLPAMPAQLLPIEPEALR
ncbi:MAG TPA: sulfotransferase [Paracoccaceae bacterium]|nr:sulfotransferase [Paracoccaceae bacterium]